MTEKSFVDSNIWVYFFTNDDPVRQTIADEWIIGTKLKFVSWQVINETCATLIHKKGKDETFIRTVITRICNMSNVVDFNVSLLESASRLRARYSTSYWDSLIVAAALAAGCSTLFSEDMQHGQKFNGMVIRNIFA